MDWDRSSLEVLEILREHLPLIVICCVLLGLGQVEVHIFQVVRKLAKLHEECFPLELLGEGVLRADACHSDSELILALLEDSSVDYL